MSKNKKSTRGGRRPGAGRKATGVNWVYCGFSVHKDDLQIIKELVKGKKKELSDKRNGIAADPLVKIAKAAPVVVTPKKIIQGNGFLDKRRNQKLGIK